MITHILYIFHDLKGYTCTLQMHDISIIQRYFLRTSIRKYRFTSKLTEKNGEIGSLSIHFDKFRGIFFRSDMQVLQNDYTMYSGQHMF